MSSHSSQLAFVVLHSATSTSEYSTPDLTDMYIVKPEIRRLITKVMRKQVIASRRVSNHSRTQHVIGHAETEGDKNNLSRYFTAQCKRSKTYLPKVQCTEVLSKIQNFCQTECHRF